MIETALLCLALNVYHEARGEPIEGQKAVAQVTMNRAEYDKKNICTVVFQPYQFEWANPITTTKSTAARTKAANRLMPDLDSREWQTAKWIASRAISGKMSDIVGDADHFLNPKTVKRMPRFAREFDKVAVIGNHTFYRSGN